MKSPGYWLGLWEGKPFKGDDDLCQMLSGHPHLRGGACNHPLLIQVQKSIGSICVGLMTKWLITESLIKPVFLPPSGEVALWLLASGSSVFAEQLWARSGADSRGDHRSWAPGLVGGKRCARAQSTHLGFFGGNQAEPCPPPPMASSRVVGRLPATFVKSSPSFAADTTSHHSGADGVCVML